MVITITSHGREEQMWHGGPERKAGVDSLRRLLVQRRLEQSAIRTKNNVGDSHVALDRYYHRRSLASRPARKYWRRPHPHPFGHRSGRPHLPLHSKQVPGLAREQVPPPAPAGGGKPGLTPPSLRGARPNAWCTGASACHASWTSPGPI